MTDVAENQIPYGYKSPITSKQISIFTGLSSSDISNTKRNNDDFPVDRNNKTGAPIYYYGDFMKWAYSHNIPVNGKKVLHWDIEKLQRESTNDVLNIAIAGRARGGKSYIAAYLIEDTVYMRQALCGGGSDYTQIPTKIIIDGSSPFFRFFVSDDELKEKAPKELKKFINKATSINPNAQDFQIAMTKINKWLKELHESGVEQLDQKVSLEIVAKPSEMSKRIMNRTGKKVLVITDTPGVSGNYKFKHLGRQDVIIITLRDENIDEFANSIEKIAELIGSSTLVYSYRISEPASDEEEYDEAPEAGQESLEGFEKAIIKAFDKDSIIASSIGALHPMEHFITLPAFKSKKYSDVERCYENDLEELIVKGYADKTSSSTLGDNLTRSGKSREEILSLLEKAIYIPKINNSDTESREKEKQAFREAKHDRVKSRDNYRLLTVVDDFSEAFLSENRKKLEGFTTKDYSEEWEQKLIKYVYETVDQAMKSFPGVGVGTHPWEDSPAVTMRTCESVLAKELYDKLVSYDTEKVDFTQSERWDITEIYRNVLRDNNIESKSWDQVIANPFFISSLGVLVKSGLLDASCQDEKELIKNCAVYGLYFRTVVDIYTDVLRGINAYEDQDQVIKMVKELFLKSVESEV